jgi:serine/threonine protein kinase/tetratricopeptide (TPR) repeat protein
MTGQSLGHYSIGAKLGEGGMGEVYRARDKRLERDVAVKLLPAAMLSDDSARSRFRREALSLARLNHPNIATIFDFNTENGVDFLAMELIVGENLKEKTALGPLAHKEVLALGIQIASALEEAHGQRIIHRDLKPGNIMVTPKGQAKVLDFGLARLFRPVSGDDVTVSMTDAQTISGTVPYMAPEQLRAQPSDVRTDIWALGVVLYEMISGKRPFQGQTGFELSAAILNQPPRSLPPGVDAGLRRVIGKCLEKDPTQRYQHVGEVRADLEGIQTGAIAEPTLRPGRRRWFALSAIVGGVPAILLLTNAGGLWTRLLSSGDGRRIQSLAVLPLENLTGDPEQEYFVDGMTDALITDLSKVGPLRVISRKTAMLYKGSQKPLKEIAKELKVEAVLGGSVAREAGRVRVSAQLTDASTEANVWAESYEREITSILSLQSEVARAVAGKIRITLRPEEQARLAASRKVNPETYEAYLRGMFWLSKGSYADVKKGLTYFEDAVQKDPADPLAYAAMSLGYLTVGHLGDPFDVSKARARAAAEKALRLDDSVAEAHLAIGILQSWTDFQWDQAMRSFDRALQLNPSLAFAHFHKAWVHQLFGRNAEAYEEVMRTRELEPLAADYMWLGDLLRTINRQKEALAEARKGTELYPKAPIGYIILGSLASDQGRHTEALAEFQKAAQVGPPFKWYIAQEYVKAGRLDDGRKMLAELERLQVTPWTAVWRAGLNAMLGNKDEAFRWLNYEPHHDWVSGFRVMDEYKPLRSDPRFAAALKRMNLPPI